MVERVSGFLNLGLNQVVLFMVHTPSIMRQISALPKGKYLPTSMRFIIKLNSEVMTGIKAIKNWRSFLTLSVGLFLFFKAVPARALFMEVNPVMTFSAAAPTQIQNGSSMGWTGNVAPGYGLLASFNLFNSDFDAELGAVYLNQTSQRDASGIAVIQNTHAIHLPLLIRYNFDERVGLGIGGYANLGEGSINTVQGGSSTYSSYSNAGVQSRDFGLLVSARASLSLLPHLYLILDGRYLHGLTNLTPPGTSGDTLNTRSMQAYLGLSYRFSVFNAAPSNNMDLMPILNRK